MTRLIRPRPGLVRRILIGAMNCMPYAGNDFSPTDPLEESPYAFDFANSLADGDTITATEWACALAEANAGTDADPGTRILGDASSEGSVSTQTCGTFQAGCIYVLTAAVTTALGATLTLWAYVRCVEPA
jgi:hypothetical protein